MNEKWPALLCHLMRGGTYGHWWTKQDTRSFWWQVDDPKKVPSGDLDVYFGVHPCSRIPPTNRSGVKKPARYVRSQEEYIETVNCVFADFDQKEFKNIGAAVSHIKSLSVSPSVIISSGGGYHCYWLLEEPFKLASSLTRDAAASLQSRWTAFVKADRAVSDIARVLRVPGTKNQKYRSRPTVVVQYIDLERTYGIEYLNDALPEGMEDASEAVEAPKPALKELEIRQIIDKALASENGRKFGKLWNGEWREDYDSQSEADLALCCHLAFWTSTAQHIDQLFRRSILYRPKWDRSDYRDPTIRKALEKVSARYIPSTGFHRTDMGNAKRLVARHGEDLRYCHPWKSWLVWDGTRWNKDELQRVIVRAKATAISIYDEVGKVSGEGDEAAQARSQIARWAARSESGPKIREMVRLAESDPATAVGPEVFDKNPWRLNVKNGVLDLKTGDLYKHTKSDMMTRLSPIVFRDTATCPRWLEFLDLVLEGDEEVIEYLQRIVGYTLTGSVQEEAFFILYGTGQNGKSTFLNVMRGLLGDYAIALMPDTLLAAGKSGLTGSAREDLARLKGTRFAAASETESGKRFATALVKRMVSSEAVTARFLYGHTFEFMPTHKIYLGTNFKPQVQSQGAAIWRRLHLIPFDIYITDEQKVTDYYEQYLEPELSGILNWALEGCLDWQETGLKQPEVVKEAVKDYKSEEDRVAEFLKDQCLFQAEGKILMKKLYREYRDWCQESGYFPMGKKRFGQELIRRPGVDKRLSGNIRDGVPAMFRGQTWFSGITLRGSMRQSLEKLGAQITDTTVEPTVGMAEPETPVPFRQ